MEPFIREAPVQGDPRPDCAAAPSCADTRRCVIVSGGTFSPVSCLREDDFIIACDSGYAHCIRLGVKPDLLISDFDSYDGDVAPDIAVDRHIPEKDDTDTMLAVRYAIEHDFSDILLCCALGGRLDHLVANLQTMVYARRHGVHVSLLSEDTEIHALCEETMVIPRREGWSLSVFAVDGPCSGVTIRGAYYPLDHAELLPSFPLGVSNRWAAEEAQVTVEEGILLVILSSLRRETPVHGIPAETSAGGSSDGPAF